MGQNNWEYKKLLPNESFEENKKRPKPSSLRSSYIIVLYVSLAFIILATVLVTNTIVLDFGWPEHESEDVYRDGDKAYFIRTEGCVIPAFAPFDPSISKYVSEVPPIFCSVANINNASCEGPLVASDENGMWLRSEKLADYGVANRSLLSCCYRPFFRVPPKDGDKDEKQTYSDECLSFDESLSYVKEEFVRAECSYNGTEFYKDFHAFVRPESVTRLTDRDDLDQKNRFNVLVLGIDGVSRLNFYRTMPQTIEFLKSLGAVDFQGYNKVGDNTYPNLIPVLTGLSDYELERVCVPSLSTRFDDCPFVWKDFAKTGYYTAYAEDVGWIGLFNYMRKGFLEKPTDFYWRTFDMREEEEIGRDSNMCVGARMTVDTLLGYAYKMVKSLVDKNYFGFFWETSLTHDHLNYPTLGDKKYMTLLNIFERDDLLESTVLVVMSDHGIRWGGIRSTHQGRMEERLPFLFIVLPDSFKERFPLASAYFKLNSKRLTTPFDLHETLVDLVDVDRIGDDRLRQRMANGECDDTRGISLFLPIGTNRTCEKAGIDTHWCTCHDTKTLDTKDATVVDVAKVVVQYINDMLKDYVQCSALSLAEIVDASIAQPSNSSQLEGVSHVNHDYTVSLRTEPGDAVFESTVRQTVDGWNVTGTISRLNLYGKQSYCVDDFRLKLYCYCASTMGKFNIFS